MPARYRPHFTEGAVLTRGIDHNLVIYPDTTWKLVSEQLNQIPITNPIARALRRLLFSGAVPLSLDRQGRMLIPVYLREYAALDGEVLVVGMESFVEIWQPQRWREALEGVSSTLAEADSLLHLSL